MEMIPNGNSEGLFDGKLCALLLVIGVFLFNVLARTVLSPLLLLVETEFSLSHTEASRIFLLISVGYGITMLLSGAISSRIHHRSVILISGAVSGAALVGAASSPTSLILIFWMTGVGLGTGLYVPSAISTITAMIGRTKWKEALALHELGPHLAMVGAPFTANLILLYSPWPTWRAVIAATGFGVLLWTLLFGFSVKEGKFHGEAPSFSNLLPLFRMPAFWVLVVFFGFGLGSVQGIYLLIPTFLIEEAGLEPRFVNQMFGISRFLPIGALLFAGLVPARIGIRKTIFITIMTAGISLSFLGIFSGNLLIAAVFLQPTIGALFFPAGLAALSSIGPDRSRNVAVSMIVPTAAFIGMGLIPLFMGYMGDHYSFGLGFLLLGIVMVCTSVLSAVV